MKEAIANIQEAVEMYLEMLSEIKKCKSKNQVKYERKIRVYKESVSVTFSLISIVLGIVTSTSIPLIAPLLIILGLIKPLGYSIGEVVELFKGLNEPPNLSQGKTNKKKLDSSESSKENN